MKLIISDLSDYNAAGHYNLISCESHNSQAKRLLRAFFEKDVETLKITPKKFRSFRGCLYDSNNF